MKPSDSDVVRSLLLARPGPEACPDANLLVGWAERRLEDARRVNVEEHLSACDGCRAEALLLRQTLLLEEHGGTVTAQPAARRLSWALRLLRAPMAMAALALVGLGAGLWASGVFSRTSDSTPAAGSDGTDLSNTSERLLAVAAELRQAQPEVFGDLDLAASARLPQPSAQRGGITLEGLPRAFLDSRPSFQWQPAAGSTTYTVRVLDAQGAPVWVRTTEATTLPYPADVAALAAGGKYVLEVRADAALGQVAGQRGFAVAAEADVVRFEEARQLSAARAGALHELLLAHLALARGFTLEAERAATAFASAHPDDNAGRVLLAQVRRMLGRH